MRHFPPPAKRGKRLTTERLTFTVVAVHRDMNACRIGFLPDTPEWQSSSIHLHLGNLKLCSQTNALLSDKLFDVCNRSPSPSCRYVS